MLHGRPVWHIYPSKELLKIVTKNEHHESMTPKYLQKPHLEYQEFDLCTFGKHVYAEAAKQLNKLYWATQEEQCCNENSQRTDKKE